MGTVGIKGRTTAAASSKWAAVSVVVAAGLGLHWPALMLPFNAGDSYALLWQSTQPGMLGQSLLQGADGFSALGSYWRPMTLLTYRLTWELFGLNAVGHHAFDLSVHIAAAVTLYGLASRLTRRPSAALLAAVMFVAHPAVTAAVWATARRHDTLAALFSLVALWQLAAARDDGRRSRVIVAGLALAVAVMSKEIALVAALPAAFLWDRTRRSAVALAAPVMIVLTVRSFIVAGSGLALSPEGTVQATVWMPATLVPIDRLGLWLPMAAVAVIGLLAWDDRRSQAAVVGATLTIGVWMAFVMTGTYAVRTSYLGIAGFSMVVATLASRRKFVPSVASLLVLGAVMWGWRIAPPLWDQVAVQERIVVRQALEECGWEGDVVSRPLPVPRAFIQRPANLAEPYSLRALARLTGCEATPPRTAEPTSPPPYLPRSTG